MDETSLDRSMKAEQCTAEYQNREKEYYGIILAFGSAAQADFQIFGRIFGGILQIGTSLMGTVIQSGSVVAFIQDSTASPREAFCQKGGTSPEIPSGVDGRRDACRYFLPNFLWHGRGF